MNAMVRLNVTRVGFLMGVSLLLAAIIYFFAANWGGLARADKILVSAGIIVLFYGVSFLFSKMKLMLGHHSFLSAVFLVAGCISFGAAVALLNQIYNSHADTYELFLVWSVPALLFSFITRYNPFYILTYVLVHLTLWQYFFPTSLAVNHSEERLLVIGGLFASINLILFLVTNANWIKSMPLKIASFVILNVTLLSMTAIFQNEWYDLAANAVSVAFIAAFFYYLIRIRLDKILLTLNALAASAYAVIRYLELMSDNASTSFFVMGLVFVAVLLTANVLFFRYLNKLGGGDEGQDGTDGQQEEKRSAVVGKIISTIVTVIGVLIGSSSLIGLVFMASGSENPENTLYALALLFVIPAILVPRLNPAIRYTVLTIGYAAGMVSIAWMDNALLSIIFMAVSAFGWFRLNGRAQHFFIYTLMNVNAAIILFQLFESVRHAPSFIVFILTAINTLVYAGQHLLSEGPMRRHISENGLFFMLLFLLWLTFMEDIFPHSGVWFSVINFAAVTALAFLFVRRGAALESAVSLTFWFVYIAFKYYDLLWTLMHKSITLALLGIFFITVTYIYAFRTRARISESEEGFKPFLRKSAVWIAIVIVLQLGYIAYHAATSEALLSGGTQVKLKIEPLDPRSLLQGDYVRLNYSISTPPSLDAEMKEHPVTGRIKVVLRQGDDGLYVFDRLYTKGETLTDKEVVINGTFNGWQSIYYGIETYFVPEGTGLETERNARYAYVRVGKNGDAILEKLAAE
ncbi:GDYXXLXY domain-containing protein [Paenibacillus sp. N4]|nr:GDYXXLXY domain-containing protein [Paenibacillus vietnamensis]